MNHCRVAANVLFRGFERDGVVVLDNAIRGHYIEALIWAALSRRNGERPTESKWINAGVGWGPWDLQRGRSDQKNRVRVQIKIKADKQLWKPQKERQPDYSLGWNEKDAPKYFSRDFDPSVFGTIENPPSYRCDLFLLGWHGIRPGEKKRRGSDQTDPNEYDFLVAAVADLNKAKKLRVCEATFKKFGRPGGEPWSFADLPSVLDDAAERFLIRKFAP